MNITRLVSGALIVAMMFVATLDSDAMGESAAASTALSNESGVPKVVSELSAEVLYEKAKAEGKVVVYAKTSAFNNVKVSFEAQYPGITVEPYKVATAELAEKLRREHNAGV